MLIQQPAGRFFLTKPQQFAFNPQTAESNAFQQLPLQHPDEIEKLALSEFDNMLSRLVSSGIRFDLFYQDEKNSSPDAIFMNNWITTHHGGEVILYPMCSQNRRTEVREDIVSMIRELGFRTNRLIDLRQKASENGFLEGTGSLVLDHIRRIAFAAISTRTHLSVAQQWADMMDFEVVPFNTVGPAPVYHTNVLLSVGKEFIIVCEKVIEKDSNWKNMMDKFEHSGKSIIYINTEQLESFCGNVLEVKNKKNDPVLVMSEKSAKAYSSSQMKTLEQLADICTVDLRVIESVGGGSARCLLTENFLPEIYHITKDIKITSPCSTDEFERYFDLRWLVLRKPWNMPKGSETGTDEDDSRHFIAIDADNEILGVGRMHSLDHLTVQFRYMAVHPEHRKQSIGKNLLIGMENCARESGHKRVFLEARENAVPFYNSQGYQVSSKSYLLFDSIQHYSMYKNLN